MAYDIYTQNENLAAELAKKLDRPYDPAELDIGTEEFEFRFFDLNDSDLSNAKKLLYENPALHTIRNSKNGSIIWPAKSGMSIDQVLDMQAP